MKINIIQELKNLDGIAINSHKECLVLKPNGDFLLNEDGSEHIKLIKTKNALILKRICVDSLLANLGQGEKDTSENKVKRYSLAIKIHESKKDIDLEAEDISLLKELIGNNYGPLVVGQAHHMLENKNKKETK